MGRFVVVAVAWFAGCGGGAADSDPASLGNVCEQALHYSQSCFGDPPSGTISDDQCTGQIACTQTCMLDASCEVLLNGQAPDPVGFQALVDCQTACLETTSGGTGSLPTTTGPDDTGTGSTGSTVTETETWTGGTDAPLAVCVTYANVYCGCLGDIASGNCVEGQTEQCDSYYDIASEFYDCVIAANCNGDWISDCTG